MGQLQRVLSSLRSSWGSRKAHPCHGQVGGQDFGNGERVKGSVYASDAPAQNGDAPSEAEDTVDDDPKEKSAKPGKSEKTEVSEPGEAEETEVSEPAAPEETVAEMSLKTKAENSNKAERKDCSGFALVSKVVQLAKLFKEGLLDKQEFREMKQEVMGSK